MCIITNVYAKNILFLKKRLKNNERFCGIIHINNLLLCNSFTEDIFLLIISLTLHASTSAASSVKFKYLTRKCL